MLKPMPQACILYIMHYRYSDNFFGGNLENALKSTIKAPLKRMSRRHDHLCHKLSNRQHERFVVAKSKISNKELLEQFRMQTESPSKHESRLVATEKPAGWHLHKSGFYLT